MNLYPIILALVALGGIGVSLWGWQTLRRARRVREWPTVSGTIEACEPTSEANDLLPNIVFSYRVDGRDYRRSFAFPEGTHPLPEFTRTYMERYPVGKTVEVYYEPGQPQNATLEPGSQGDWMILALGLMMTAGGIIALLIA